MWAHHADGTSEIVGGRCYLPGQQPPPQEITPGLVATAFRRVPVPAAELAIQPPKGATLVGLDTIFSTRTRRFTTAVRLLGQRVRLDIRPASYTWIHGDGTTETTDWAGHPWRRGDSESDLAQMITHVYDDPAHHLATRVDTRWTARYRVGSGPWADVPGTVTVRGTSSALRVRTAAPRLTG